MLSRSPALRAASSKPYNIGGSTPYSLRRAGSQLSRYRAPTLTDIRLNSTSAGPNRVDSLLSIRRSGRKPTGYESGQLVVGRRHASQPAKEESDPAADQELEQHPIYPLIDKITTTEAEILELLDELDLTDAYGEATASDDGKLDDALDETNEDVDEQTVEIRVQRARQLFGHKIPEGHLSEQETAVFTRLYGEPIIVPEDAAELEEEPESDQLFRADGIGGWEEVPYEATETQEDAPVVYDMEKGPPVKETAAMRRTREVAEQLGGEVLLDSAIEGEEEGYEETSPRLHPLTMKSKFSTDPNTIFPPKDTLTGPIGAILSDASNKHISEAATNAFGGKFLPQSARTAPAQAQEPQKPIGLSSSQRFMSEMEANAYIAVLYPAMYASTLSVLTEVRKRLGSEWLRSLISQEGGPNVLDAGAGGAGVLAWRDVLRAEYELMVPDHHKGAPYPLGRSTVLTGSDPLRLRASVMLENTTFLPRLPDYIHTREGPTIHDQRVPKRKQFDVIIAPHTLLGIDEEHERKEYVENLWRLLNPNGGVLILMEKGHQRGFEAIGGAREMLLKRYISSPGSTEYNDLTESPRDGATVQKEPGMIIAPCTNHERCPMYQTDGQAKGRKDFCHFSQRYIRPAFHQRIIGARDHNHEDLKFSYLAVQRGVDLRQTEGIKQGPEATDAAFEGYEHLYEVAEETESAEVEAPSEPDQKFHPLSLPRVVYTPMKRRGHVIFDLCTPAGKIERWTVPRSFSRQAYKDARKAYWGDLWALGAKTRIPRNLRLGDKKGEGKKERLERRAAEKRERGEEDDEGEFEVDFGEQASPRDLSIPTRKKGEKKVPSWKKQADNKKLRHASRKFARENL